MQLLTVLEPLQILQPHSTQHTIKPSQRHLFGLRTSALHIPPSDGAGTQVVSALCVFPTKATDISIRFVCCFYAQNGRCYKIPNTNMIFKTKQTTYTVCMSLYKDKRWKQPLNNRIAYKLVNYLQLKSGNLVYWTSIVTLNITCYLSYLESLIKTEQILHYTWWRRIMKVLLPWGVPQGPKKILLLIASGHPIDRITLKKRLAKTRWAGSWEQAALQIC